jgi:penicillin amidase
MIKKILLTILTILILGLAVGYFYLQTTKPIYHGKISLENLQDSVSVYHDAYGIPHIYAQNANDAYFSLGYLHAQERLFQMEIIKRVASGRLAEIVGDKALKSDKFFRTLGIAKQANLAAKEFLSSRDLPYQQASWSYIDGVNAFIDHGPTPLEFHLMGIPKEQFTPEDIYHTIGLMAFGFADGFREDPLMTQIKNQLGEAYLKDIMHLTDGHDTLIPVEAPDTTLAKTSAILASNFSEIFEDIPTPLWLGSNGWALAGNRTISGKPMLANDTHIGYSQPSVWFEAHIEYPGFRFYGQHAAGIPFGVLGHNEHLGWGFTMFENDDVDFFTEEIANNEYLSNGAWRPLTSNSETIKVKDADDVSLKIQTTHHGPIVNNIFDEIDSAANPVSVWWAFAQFPSTVVGALYQLNHAENIDQVTDAAAKIPAPGLNLMYADHENIGWWALAKLPIRAAHVNSKLIHDGTSGSDDHLGYYPFDKNPHNVNPANGMVFTTNNQPDSVDEVLYAGYYRPKDRASRAAELLSNTQPWTQAHHQEVQLDVNSPTDTKLAKLIAELISTTNNNSEWADKLRGWNGDHNLANLAPGVYYTLLSQILFQAMMDEMGYEGAKKIANSVAMRGAFYHFIDNENSPWWDNINTKTVEDRGDIIKIALTKSIDILENKYGENQNYWEWSTMHQLTHKHPLAVVKPLDKIFNVGPFPIKGGLEVLNNQKFKLDTIGVYDVIAGPAVRWVLDFADFENSIGILPTGQSGNLMSPHYGDQAQMFIDGAYRKQLMNKAEITNSSSSVLILKPNN